MRSQIQSMNRADKQWLTLMHVGERLGCHQMPERSFFYHNYQFPVCARCTGVIISALIALIVFIKKKISITVCVIMSCVMFADWFIQFIGLRDSTNKRRFVTGLIGGFGYSTLHLYFYRFIWRTVLKKT